MSATTAKINPADAKKMLKLHADAITARKSATGPGQKMKATKAIDAIELTMWRAGVTFDAYTPEPKITARKYDLTPEQLLTEITDLRNIAADESAPARIRATADTTAQRLTAQAERRSIEIPAA